MKFQEFHYWVRHAKCTWSSSTFFYFYFLCPTLNFLLVLFYFSTSSPVKSAADSWFILFGIPVAPNIFLFTAHSFTFLKVPVPIFYKYFLLFYIFPRGKCCSLMFGILVWWVGATSLLFNFHFDFQISDILLTFNFHLFSPVSQGKRS